jgi:hypothetical protein
MNQSVWRGSMKQIERQKLMDIPCNHLKFGKCNIKNDVKIFPINDIQGGSSCIRWDDQGHLLSGVRFDDCPNYKKCR